MLPHTVLYLDASEMAKRLVKVWKELLVAVQQMSAMEISLKKATNLDWALVACVFINILEGGSFWCSHNRFHGWLSCLALLIFNLSAADTNNSGSERPSPVEVRSQRPLNNKVSRCPASRISFFKKEWKCVSPLDKMKRPKAHSGEAYDSCAKTHFLEGIHLDPKRFWLSSGFLGQVITR